MHRKKILFVAEAVTLAHVGRPLTLAQGLDEARHEVHFACTDGYDFCFQGMRFQRWRINSIPSQQFLQALAQGKPVYDEATLQAYVEDDLRLFDAVRPDLVIGDFRLSLSVSARLRGIPYITVSNAYWSPHVRQHYTVPSLPLTRMLPIWLADPLFRLIRPLAFASHAIPLNRVRRHHGLSSLGSDLRRIYTDADQTLYADIPQLFPPQAMPAHHGYLGAVVWAPPMALPQWWQQLVEGKESDRPLLYVTLGSSGQSQLLPRVLQALSSLPVTVMAATAGTIALASVPPNAHVAPFLPGDAAARHASLVICNGGSPTSQQALTAGVPVIGIAGNLDQYLNMHGIVAAGAGLLLRADRYRDDALRQAVTRLLDDRQAQQAARQLAAAFHACPAAPRLLERIQMLTG
ncbi:glycosyltransferase [Janthinobacterium psychrotolerans]|uniref:UDP:flavonoid glycosyltransferase YjiC, YdhE family n=1 Tax=Janthinobacterium psychrotolerans TaxID=1747903 RepID=A0A1A7C6T6_9BURK|nr:glycosyltransferase [Janthinobacterium psychrotolerans]OBV40744.1 UDP:flavonoid glycosyltransferase YjiC, YdhE family [Janthinobacterium psychrotolerans]